MEKRQRGLNAQKGMYVDGQGVLRYRDQPQPIEPGAGKGRFHVTVTRKVYDSKGEVTRKNVQEADVFCQESRAAAYGVRQCPDPWPGGDGDVRTRVTVRKA